MHHLLPSRGTAPRRRPTGRPTDQHDRRQNGKESKRTHLGIGYVNGELLDRIEDHAGSRLHLAVREQVWMKAGEEPAHQFALPRSLVQSERYCPLHHLGMVRPASHLVDAAHHLVEIGRIEVLPYRVRRSNLEFRQGEEGTVHGAIGAAGADGYDAGGGGCGAAPRPGLAAAPAAKDLTGRIVVLLGYVEGIIGSHRAHRRPPEPASVAAAARVAERVSDGIIGTQHALTAPPHPFGAIVVSSRCCRISLLPGDLRSCVTFLVDFSQLPLTFSLVN